MSDFDLEAAKKLAAEESEKNFTLAAGTAGNALDDLVKRIAADPSLTQAEKTRIFSAIAENGKAIAQAALSGKITTGISSGARFEDDKSSSAKIEELEDQVAELEDKLRKAETANENLLKDRKVLERLVTELPTTVKVTMPKDTSTPFSTDTPDRVKKAIDDTVKEKVDEAKVSGGTSSKDTVAKADVKKEVDKLQLDKARAGRVNTSETNLKVKLDVVKDASENLKRLLS